jgi:hypothetical protein
VSRSQLTKVFVFASIITTALIFGCQTQSASAVNATDFKAGNIISDAVFYNKDAMTLAQIESFIQSKTVSCDTWGTKPVGSGRTINGVAVDPNTTRAKYAEMMKNAGNTRYHQPPYICLSNYYENPTTRKTSFDSGALKESGMLSAAEIIYEAAQTYNINPQVLLVTLKKEYSYVYTDDWPLRDQYNTVMGYACPDSGPGNSANCDSKYYGFYNQVMNAAWQFNYYKQNITKYNYQPYRNNTIQYTTTSSCGSKQVYIENIATASLYIYTPYTPNAAALSAYPGTATCGSYGNRNFFMFFNEWFGDTQAQISKTKVSPAPGEYYLVPKNDYEQSVQVSQNSPSNSISIVQNKRVENSLDTLRLVKNTDDSFSIINIATTRAFDVPNASAIENAKIWQYQNNGSAAQKWYFYDNGNGSYSIIPTLNDNLALTKATDGSIQLNTYIKSTEQSFRIIPTTQYIKDDTYSVHSHLKSNFAMHVASSGTTNGTAIQGYASNNAASQRFQFSYDSKTGYYTITNPLSSKVIDATNAGITNGTGIQIYTSNGSCAQQWMIEKWDEDEYEILSACSGKAIDVANASTVNGVKLQLYLRNNSAAQKWSAYPINTSQPIADGIYNITNSLKDNYTLDVSNGNTTNYTNIWMYGKNNSAAQLFKLEYDLEKGTYTITNPKSGKVLDVSGAGKTNGTNVQIYTSNGSCAQQWIIAPTSDSTYEIASSCSGLVLDVSGGGKVNGTNVQIYTNNDSAAQKWNLTLAN